MARGDSEGIGSRATRRVHSLVIALSLIPVASLAQVRSPRIFFEDAQLFRPATDPSRFVSVYDTRNLEPGRYTIGGYANYANDPVKLVLEESDTDSGDLVTDAFGVDLVGAIGLTPRFQVGIDIPYVHTEVEDVFNFGNRIDKGGDFLGDVRLEAKYTFLERPPGYGIGLSLLPRVILPTGSRRDFAGTGRVGGGGLILFDARYAKINYGLNVGGLIRDGVGQADDDDRFDDQILYGLGVAVPATRYLDVIGELNGRTAFKNTRSNPLEGLLGFRFHSETIAFTIGIGAGAIESRGAPRFRVMASLTPYVPEREIPEPMADLVTSSRKTWALDADVDGDGRPNPGDTLEYTVTLVNTGAKDAEEVVFVDEIPELTSYVPGSMSLNGAPVTDQVDGDAGDYDATNPGAVTVQIGTIGNQEGANTAEFRFRVTVDPEILDLAVVRNEAVVYHEDQPAQPETDPETGPRAGERLRVTETTVFPSIRERETVVVTPDKLEITRNIHFEFNKATIRSESYPVLNDVAGVLTDNPALDIMVEGHTDSVGSLEYNQRLSNRRAESVRTYLIQRGISASRLDSVGRGELAPIASNETPVGRAMNRRVEFLITNPEVLKGRQIEKRPFVEDITPESEPPALEGDLARPAPAAPERYAPSAPSAPATQAAPPESSRSTLEVQRGLIMLGYNPGGPTGIMTAQTEEAIRRFQQHNGLPVTGKPDAITRKAVDEALELERDR